MRRHATKPRSAQILTGARSSSWIELALLIALVGCSPSEPEPEPSVESEADEAVADESPESVGAPMPHSESDATPSVVMEAWSIDFDDAPRMSLHVVRASDSYVDVPSSGQLVYSLERERLVAAWPPPSRSNAQEVAWAFERADEECGLDGMELNELAPCSAPDPIGICQTLVSLTSSLGGRSCATVGEVASPAFVFVTEALEARTIVDERGDVIRAGDASLASLWWRGPVAIRRTDDVEAHAAVPLGEAVVEGRLAGAATEMQMEFLTALENRSLDGRIDALRALEPVLFSDPMSWSFLAISRLGDGESPYSLEPPPTRSATVQLSAVLDDEAVEGTGPAPSGAQVVLESATGAESDVAWLRTTLDARAEELRACYLVAAPGAASRPSGQLVYSFQAGNSERTPTVELGEDTLEAPSVSECISRRLRTWTREEGGGPVTLTLSFDAGR